MSERPLDCGAVRGLLDMHRPCCHDCHRRENLCALTLYTGRRARVCCNVQMGLIDHAALVRIPDPEPERVQ